MVVLYSSSMLGSTLLFSFVQDRQQKYLFASMSVIFIPFILRVPAGVGVYWITTNIWTICQQGIVKRTMGAPLPGGGEGSRSRRRVRRRATVVPHAAQEARRSSGRARKSKRRR